MMLCRMRAAVVWVAGLTVIAAVPAAIAQTASQADKQFVRFAIETNNAEIAAAHLALEKSSSDDVKQFAMRMIHDHTMLNEQMKPIASQIDVQVAPGQVSAKQQALASQLRQLNGTAFDQQYIPAMVRGHRRALAKIKEEIATAKNPQVKDAAQKAEPVIQTHLQLAENMARDHHIKVGKK